MSHLVDAILTGDLDVFMEYMWKNNIRTPDDYPGYHKPDWFVATPLAAAARCGNIDIVDYLLTIGFSYWSGSGHRTPMVGACMYGHIVVVKVLVNLHDVNVNAVYRVLGERETALSMASSFGYLEIVQYLIEMGASVEPVIIINDNPSMTPLTLTASQNPGGYIEDNVFPESTPFYQAVRNDKLEIAKILYSNGANPETRRNRFFGTPLEFAIQRNCYQMVRYLVVDLNLPREENLNLRPEDMAYHHDSPSVIKLLIDAGLSSSESIQDLCNRSEVPEEVKTDLKVFLEQTSSNPRTLQQLSCFKVRRLLGRNLSRGVDTIPLPGPLIDFVKLSHIPLRRPHVKCEYKLPYKYAICPCPYVHKA